MQPGDPKLTKFCEDNIVPDLDKIVDKTVRALSLHGVSEKNAKFIVAAIMTGHAVESQGALTVRELAFLAGVKMGKVRL